MKLYSSLMWHELQHLVIIWTTFSSHLLWSLYCMIDVSVHNISSLWWYLICSLFSFGLLCLYLYCWIFFLTFPILWLCFSDHMADNKGIIISTSEASLNNFKITKGDRLILRGLKFHGYHGVHLKEKEMGQTFLVDVDAWLDLRAAGKSDDLNDTVSYTAIYRWVLCVKPLSVRFLIWFNGLVCITIRLLSALCVLSIVLQLFDHSSFIFLNESMVSSYYYFFKKQLFD